MTKEKKHKILIVEDESSLRMAMVDKLDREGYEVLEAIDGRVGLELAEKEKPDLILLDLLMPGMDGLTMVGHLQKTPETKDIPIIVLTNSSGPDTIMDVVNHGINDYMVKSDWSINDIADKVKKKLAQN